MSQIHPDNVQDELWRRSQESRRNWSNPKHPDFCMRKENREEIKQKAKEQTQRDQTKPWITMEDKRIPMEEAGVFFYPEKLAIGPMNADGTPDIHTNMMIHASDIDMSDMGEFSSQNYNLIITTLRRSQT